MATAKPSPALHTLYSAKHFDLRWLYVIKSDSQFQNHKCKADTEVYLCSKWTIVDKFPVESRLSGCHIGTYLDVFQYN